MARQKSGFLSAMGKAWEIFRTIVNAVLEIDGSDEDMEKILTTPGLARQIAELICGKAKLLLRRVGEPIPVNGAEQFTPNEEAQKGANIGWIGETFKRVFGKKVEMNVPATNLVVSVLETNSLDAPILTELGKQAATTLAYMFGLIKKQAYGEKGVLLVNGYANIFYILDDGGILWAVRADWHAGSGYWDVEAHSVAYPPEWGAGHQVFSRDSCPSGT